MKKRICLSLAALMLLLSLAACGGGGSSSAGGSPSAAEGEASLQTSQSQDAPQESLQAESGAGQNAKLIRRAELHIQTEDFDASAGALEALVAEYGGYFQSARSEGGSLRNQDAARYGEYVIRLPEERFHSFLNQSGTLGYVLRSAESSENVSQAYYDTETRLDTQRTKQARLLALLEQADTMENILELENALSETEYEIQTLTTDLEHYDDLIDYATVTLYLEEVLQISQSPGEAASLGERMAAGAASSLQGLVQGVQNLLVWVSYNLVLVLVLLVLAAAGWFGWRFVVKKRRET